MISRLRNFGSALGSSSAAQYLCWLATALWLAQPFLLWPLLSDALHDRPHTFVRIVTLAASALWLVILVSLTARLPVTLVIARIGAASTVAVSIWAAIDVQQITPVVLGVAGSIAVTAVVLAPGVADRFINGASYGSEQRFALRAPGPVLVLLIVPAWAAVFFGLTVGPLLLADQQWLAGAAAIVAGFPIALVAFNALYRLTARFIVFVPNGLVLHDRTVLREPVLFTRRAIVGLAPAQADTDATDLTAAALGLALEVKLGSATTLPVVSGRKSTHEVKVESLLIAPTRPADVMRVAKQRGINIA